MNISRKTSHRLYNVAVVAGLSLFLNIILYPTIFAFTASPLFPKSWALQDPVVSVTNFIPGINAVRFELFEHRNLLWTRLRNMGTPILGNEIQAAPLFPLTLALLWIPDPKFWNAFVIVRLLLLSAGTFLVAVHILRISRFAAIAFTLVFAYSVDVARLINHPWQNGLVAGIWLLFFLGRALQIYSAPWGGKRLLNCFGIAVSAYAVVTCGFPEASAMCAVLCLLVIGPMLIERFVKQPRTISNALLDCGIGVVSGVMVGSIQIFALLDYVSQVAAGYRTSHGLHQYDSFSVFLNTVLRLSSDIMPGEMQQTFGLLPLMLFFVGVIVRLRPKTWNIYDILGTTPICAYVLKCFPVWPAFNQVVGQVPLLRESWFTGGYFMPIILFGFAYFCARGLEFVLTCSQQHEIKSLLCYVGSATAITIVLAGAAIATSKNVEICFVLAAAAILVAFVGLITWVSLSERGRIVMPVSAAGVVILFIAQSLLDKPSSFFSYKSEVFREHAIAKTRSYVVAYILRAANIELPNVRDDNDLGRGWNVRAGIATIDNGNPAIMSMRAQLFRGTMFIDSGNAANPIEAERRDGAYRIAGRNISMHPRPEMLSGGRLLSGVLFFDELSPGRAFVARRCHAAASPADAAEKMKSPDAFAVGDVAIEAMTESELAFCQQMKNEDWRNVPVTEDVGSLIQLSGLNGPSILTLNDSYDSGWRARDRVTGGLLQIRPTNINFRSVFLPESRRYEIEFIYSPHWLPWSQYLIGLTGLFWCAAVVLAVSRGKGARFSKVG